MEDKFSKNRTIINGHFGIMPKMSPDAWKEVAECAKKITEAVNKLSKVAKNFKAPAIK